MTWHCARGDSWTATSPSGPLGELPMALVASPEHLERNGRPGSLEDLSRAAHVRYMLGGPALSDPASWTAQTVSPEGRLDLDSGFRAAGSCAQLVLASLTSCAVRSKPDINSGRLEIILPQRQLERVPLHFLHAFGRIPPLRARLFMDFVAAEIAGVPGMNGVAQTKMPAETTRRRGALRYDRPVAPGRRRN